MTVMKKEKKRVYTKCLNNMQMCFKSVIALIQINTHKTILYNIAPLAWTSY